VHLFILNENGLTFIYILDKVVGFIYNNSRYYDPETCRFISPDVISIIDETSNTINGLNLYMYCNDNPVMMVDPSGHFAISSLLIGIAIFLGTTTIVGTTVGGILAGMAGDNIFEGVGKGALNGLVFGSAILLTVGGLTIWNTPLGSFVVSYGISVISNMLEVIKYDWKEKNIKIYMGCFKMLVYCLSINSFTMANYGKFNKIR